MTSTINPTASDIAQYTSTAKQIGKNWVHKLFNEKGELIATRKSNQSLPYSAACIEVATRNCRISYLKKQADKSRCKSYIKSCYEDIALEKAAIDAGADACEYFGCRITWTRCNPSGGYGCIIARLVPTQII